MKKQLQLIGSITGVMTCLMSVCGSYAFAATAPVKQTPNAGQALEIAPPLVTLSGNPGDVIHTQILLRDISSSNLLVSGQVNDFIAAGEDGTPKIILNADPTNPYSIKSWIATLPSLLMVPHQIKTLPVTITVPTTASPGGHYGVIRFSAVPPELKGQGVSLSASLGSLVLFNVNGKTVDKLSVAGFTVSHGNQTGSLFQSGPVTFTERIQNGGNTHEEPTGQINITDMFGKKVAGIAVNIPTRNILPSSVRKFSQPLDSSVIGSKKLFGHYKASLTLSYGASKQTATASLSFWVIPYTLIGIIIVLLVGGFFVLRISIKRYNRRIIQKSQATPKKR